MNSSRISYDGEELKQCALFNDVQSEKSRLSVLEGDRDKSGLPVFLHDGEKSGYPICLDAVDGMSNSSMLMFEGGIQDLATGASLKQKGEESSPECMRVTTTEANDIFDDEIWNNSICF